MPYFLGHIASGLFLFLIYILVASCSYTFVIPPNSSAVFWLPSGITFSVFFWARWTPQIWPVWFLAFFSGELLIVTFNQVPPITAFLWSTANVVLPLTVVFLTRNFVFSSFDFRRIRDVLTFYMIVPIAVIPSSIISTFGSSMDLPAIEFLTSAISWASSDALGIFLVAPIILSWSSKAPKSAGTFLEGILLLLILTIFSYGVFFYPMNVILDQTFFSILIFFVAWASIRFGPRGTTLSLIIIDLVEVWSTVQGYGPFKNISFTSTEKLLALQISITNIGFLMLLLAAAIEEQRTARVEAETALKLRDDFLSLASHELKTPLTSLAMQVQILNHYISKNELTHLSMPKLNDLVRLSNQQIRKFSFLVNNLLDVSRISVGQLDIHPEQVDFTQLVRDIIDGFKLDLEKSFCPVVLHADERILGWWDRFRLEQVVTNLLSNAIKYGPSKPIDITVQHLDLKVRLTIRDHGIGISKTDHTRIFGRFERAVTIKQFGGLGLGLFIVQQIVEAHRGEIRVESEPGQGSTFIVELPKNCKFE